MNTLRVGRITSSDRASAGVYEDISGPEIEKHVAALLSDYALEWERVVLPDEVAMLSGAMSSASACGTKRPAPPRLK